MRLSALIERLQELQDELRFVHGERFDPEVLGATQPQYPLAGVIQGAAGCEHDTKKAVVWIAVGGAPAGMSPYAPHEAWGGE